MSNPRVALYYRCKTERGWKRYPAAFGRNGKIRPRFARVGTAQVRYEQGRYELRLMENGKMIWRDAGDDATHAQAEQAITAKRLAVRVAADDLGLKVEGVATRVRLVEKAKAFSDRQTARGKKRSVQIFDQTIEGFLPIANVTYLDELTEEIILRWYAALRKRGNSDRTVANKHSSLFQFLRWAGVDTTILAERAPSYTEKAVETYTKADLATFFDSLTKPYHRIVFETLLKTGMRMREAMFLEWHEIDFARGTITVCEKDDLGFTIKDRAERTLPIPSELVDALKSWKEKHGGGLVLGTSNDTANGKWLPLLKRLARKAGLNCGHCQGCKEQDKRGKEKGECGRWVLHKFRATYTTNLLRAGIDVRTVMQYTGHEDMATVLRYLSPAEGSETQAKVNTIQWT